MVFHSTSAEHQGAALQTQRSVRWRTYADVV